MIKTIKIYFQLLCVLAFVLALSNCKKDDFTTDPSAKLSFSNDTLSFDTVFTTVGSATRGFVIYNRNREKVNVSSINLGMGADSPFRMNVDGTPTHQIEDVEIWAEDSIYIFVEVTVDPNADNMPFVVSDSVVFETNGNIQDVQLVAWGQNAHFYGTGTPNGEIVCDEVWTNDKPYVIYNGIIVDTLCTLTIEAGTRIHLHNNAILYVAGSLQVNGGMDTTDWVIFQGTRLEEWYAEVPGQWGNIHLLPGSTNNRINGALIKNGLAGIIVGSFLTDENSFGQSPDLNLQNTVIRNTVITGIWSLAGLITAGNCVIYNSQTYDLFLTGGGVYNFAHCTFANYSNSYIDHRNPILRFQNYITLPDENGNPVFISTDLARAAFYNCTLYGSEDEETCLDSLDTGGTYQIRFVNCILKTMEYPHMPNDPCNYRSANLYTNCFLNPSSADTVYVNAFDEDYQPSAVSKANDAGTPLSEIPFSGNLDLSRDLIGTPRNGATPDIGAYERQ